MPPCRSYRNLISLVDFDEFFDKFELAATPADLTSIKAEVKPFKGALNDLIQTSRAAVTAMKSAMKAGIKQKGADDQEARKSSGNAKSIQHAINLFELGPEKGIPIPRVPLGGSAAVALPADCCAFPFILTGFLHDDKDTDPFIKLREVVDKFFEKFRKSTIRLTEGRAERLIKGDVRDIALDMFSKVFLGDAFLSFDKVHAELQPASFGITKGRETISTERGRGATLRLQFQGPFVKTSGSL